MKQWGHILYNRFLDIMFLNPKRSSVENLLCYYLYRLFFVQQSELRRSAIPNSRNSQLSPPTFSSGMISHYRFLRSCISATCPRQTRHAEDAAFHLGNWISALRDTYAASGTGGSSTAAAAAAAVRERRLPPRRSALYQRRRRTHAAGASSIRELPRKKKSHYSKNNSRVSGANIWGIRVWLWLILRQAAPSQWKDSVNNKLHSLHIWVNSILHKPWMQPAPPPQVYLSLHKAIMIFYKHAFAAYIPAQSLLH